jgi:fibronectin type 3 domain-containing protein
MAAGGDRQVTLSWDASTDNVKVVFYQVFRDGIPIGAQETRTFTDTGLVNGTTYTYTVFAHDSSDNVSQESMAVATPSDAQAPTVPTGLAATPGNAQVSLTWNTSTDNIAVTAYQVYRSSGGGPYSLVASPTTPYFADTTVSNGTTYSYKVGAVDAAANASAQTAVVTATPLAGADMTPPSVPTGLGATPGSTQVALTWTASTDNVAVTGYRVFRNGVQVAAPSGTSYTDTGLANGTSYTYTVAAVDAAANASAQSSPGVAATPADTLAPTVPSGLVATGGNAQVALTWTASTDNVGVTGYHVYRSSGGGAYAQIATPATAFYTDTTVTNGTAYSYRVAAVDAASNASAQSSTATATPAVPADAQAPSTPGTPTATPGTNQVALSWAASTDNVGVTGYRVFRSSGGGGYVQIAAPAGTTYTDTGLTNGTAYSYKISAVDAAANQSPQSAAGTATPADTQAPTVPAGLTATGGSGQVALTWTASTDNVGVTGYRVYRLITGVYTLVASPATAFYTDTGLTAATAYSYKVAAVDASSNASAQSAVATATTAAAADTTAPSTPAGLVATAGTNQVSLTWTASTDNVGVTGYRVYRSSGGGAYTQIGTPVGTSYTDATAVNGTAYSYKVAAVDAAANVSAQSAVATATPGDTTPPSVPTIIAVTKNNSAHTITITWTASTDNVGVLKYMVYRSKNGAAAVVAGQPSTLSYLENNLSNGATYAYQVSAVDTSNNESAKSPVVSTYVS